MKSENRKDCMGSILSVFIGGSTDLVLFALSSKTRQMQIKTDGIHTINKMKYELQV